MESSYSDMSPIIFPKGFTRDYLDGKIDEHQMKEKIIGFQGRVPHAQMTKVMKSIQPKRQNGKFLLCEDVPQ